MVLSILSSNILTSYVFHIMFFGSVLENVCSITSLSHLMPHATFSNKVNSSQFWSIVPKTHPKSSFILAYSYDSVQDRVSDLKTTLQANILLPKNHSWHMQHIDINTRRNFKLIRKFLQSLKSIQVCHFFNPISYN